MAARSSNTASLIQYVRNDDLLAAPLAADGTVMLDVEKGAYFGVRGSAQLLWDRLSQPASLGDLADALCDHYPGLEPERARSDAEVFLADCLEQGLARPTS